jgi:hypothetical protein
MGPGSLTSYLRTALRQRGQNPPPPARTAPARHCAAGCVQGASRPLPASVPDLETLRSRLRAVLEYQGLSLRALARQVPGYSHDSYRAMLRGARPLNPAETPCAKPQTTYAPRSAACCPPCTPPCAESCAGNSAPAYPLDQPGTTHPFRPEGGAAGSSIPGRVRHHFR